MSTAYVDPSVFVSLAFREAEAERMRRRLMGFETVITSVLAEAEVASALRRENVVLVESPFLGVELIGAPEPLHGEIHEVLQAGYLRGADCWHVAVALNYSPDRDLVFVTLDNKQKAVAAKLGFKI